MESSPTEIKDGTNKHIIDSNVRNDIHNNIMQFFIGLMNPHDKIDISTIRNELNNLIDLLSQNVGTEPFKKSLSEFVSKCGQNSLFKTFEKIENEYQYYYYSYLVQFLFKNILNQPALIQKLNESVDFDSINPYNINNPESKKYITICDSVNNSGQTYLLTAKFDELFNIFYQAQFAGKTEKKTQENAKEILSKKISKFIPTLVDEENNTNNLILPYFPMGTLHDNLKQTIKLTLIDKIVIILEIAYALHDLHDNGYYHGNLSSHFIFLNSFKDAYITIFFYDRACEPNLSQMKGPIMYRIPKNYYSSIDESRKLQLNDIYSFGVLTHEILSGKSNEARMETKPRGDRLSILNGNLFDFLYENEENEEFKDDLLIFKNIIRECMKEDENNDMGNIIKLIKNLKIYQENETEIEYRINNAIDGSDFQCSFADLVESFYLGQKESLNVIKKLFKNLNLKKKTFMEKENDLVKEILDTLEIKMNDVTYIFSNIFDLIIQNYSY